ncbi:hypothetical protein CISIN_1g032307mg [Citrus sinensis]|uniref:Uncharacterized protein n=1 Tax=Citrus sinensis TaxID=2711 RepID=A0A067D7N6_CITSI|nr:hypothetical protein CISIN_1g032307mg [Citrus sinensis]
MNLTIFKGLNALTSQLQNLLNCAEQKHCKNLIAASSSGASFTGVNVVGNSTPGGSIAEPSLNASTPIPKQSTRGSTTKKTPATEESIATNEAIRISRAKKRRRNASTARNKSFDQFSVPLIRGIEIREGGKFDGLLYNLPQFK